MIYLLQAKKHKVIINTILVTVFIWQFFIVVPFLEFIFENKLFYNFVSLLFKSIFSLLICYHPLFKRSCVVVAKVKEEKTNCLVMKKILGFERKYRVILKYRLKYEFSVGKLVLLMLLKER